MHIRPFTLFILVLLSLHAGAQRFSLDMLTIDVPDGWSEQSLPGRTVFSNYASNQTDPVTVTIYRKTAYPDKPELAFANQWRAILHLADTTTAPRARKMYTNDGQLFYLGGAEINGPDGFGYYQLGVYLHNKFAQTIAIKYANAKTWRTQQYEHAEKLQAIKVN